MSELIQTQSKESSSDDILGRCDDHNETFNMKCLTCQTNICTECISSDKHIGHKIKSLKFLLEEAKQKVIHTKDELQKYLDKVVGTQDKLKQLKKHKEDNAKKAAFSLQNKIETYLNQQSKRVGDAFSYLDVHINSASEEKLKINKLQTDVRICLELEKSFDSISSMNELCTKMEALISNQTHIDMLKSYDELKNASLSVEHEQKVLKFQIKVSDLEKSRIEPVRYKEPNSSIVLSIKQNEHNQDAFDVYLTRGAVKKAGTRTIVKIQLKPFADASIVMGNLEASLTDNEPEAKVGKILILSSENLKSDNDLNIKVFLEDLENKDKNIELGMLLGLQEEINRMIIDNICKHARDS